MGRGKGVGGERGEGERGMGGMGKRGGGTKEKRPLKLLSWPGDNIQHTI